MKFKVFESKLFSNSILVFFVVFVALYVLPLTGFCGWFLAEKVPDISVDRVETVPSAPLSNSPVKFKIYLRNKGTEPLKDVPVLLLYKIVDDNKKLLRSEKQMEYIDHLPVGETIIVSTMSLNIKFLRALHYFRLHSVSLGGKLKGKEEKLDDNKFNHTFVVRYTASGHRWQKPVGSSPSSPKYPLYMPSPPQKPVPLLPPRKPPLPKLALSKVEEGNTLKDLSELRERARAFKKAGKHEQAASLYKRIVSLSDITLGGYHDFTLDTLFEYFKLFSVFYKRNSGLPIGQDLIARLEKKNGKNSKTLVVPLEALWLVCPKTAEGNQIAYNSLKRAYFLRKKINLFGEERTQALLSAYAFILRETGRYDECLEIIEEAIGLRENNKENYFGYGACDERTIMKLCKVTGENYEDLPVYHRAMKLKEANSPKDLASQAEAFYKKALALQYGINGSDIPRAYKSIRKALKLGEEAHGTKSVALLHFLKHSAEYADELGKTSEARSYFERAVRICRQSKDKNARIFEGNTSKDLAAFYEKHNINLKVAKKLYQNVVNINEERFGSTHINTGMALADLGFFYGNIKQPEEGLPLLRRALSIYVESRGDDHFFTQRILWNLNEVCRSLDLVKEAEGYKKRIKPRKNIFH